MTDSMTEPTVSVHLSEPYFRLQKYFKNFKLKIEYIKAAKLIFITILNDT